MATYTKAQWNRLNASLPVEDRTSYDDYLASLKPATPAVTPTVTPTATPATTKYGTAFDAANELGTITSLGALDILTNTNTSGTTSGTTNGTTSGTPATTSADASFTPEQIAAIKAKRDKGIMLNDAEAEAIGLIQSGTGILGTPTPTATVTPTVTPTSKIIPPRIAAILAKKQQGMALNDGEIDELTAWQQGTIGTTATSATTTATTATTTATTATTAGNEYTTAADGTLLFKGMPFGGLYQGKTYIAGKVFTPGGDYTTVNGVLNFKGTPFTGSYDGKEYVNGKVSSGGGGKYATVNGVFMFNNLPFNGEYEGKTYKDGIVTTGGGGGSGGNWVHDAARDTTNADGTINWFEYWSTDPTKTQVTKTGVANGPDNWTGDGTPGSLFSNNGKAFTGTKFGSTYVDGVLKSTEAMTAETIAKEARLSARQDFADTLKGLGFDKDLTDTIDAMIVNDYTVAKMKLELLNTPAWKKRFPGMDALAAAGKAVDAATYISMEKSMLQTLGAYGLDKNIFGTTLELGKYISNLTSPGEFEDRVNIAANRVEKNADVLAELNLYYGVDKAAAISYLLDPTKGIDLIKKQARAAEIGAAAANAKFTFGSAAGGYGVAESFINAAGTEDLQALKTDFQSSRQLADNQSRLAQIEGQEYNDLDAVTAILGKDQVKILESQKRAARETARFGGASGIGSASLKSESGI